MVVRNVAFEATRKDILGLFTPFGAVKSCRLPRKFDGTHRWAGGGGRRGRAGRAGALRAGADAQEGGAAGRSAAGYRAGKRSVWPAAVAVCSALKLATRGWPGKPQEAGLAACATAVLLQRSPAERCPPNCPSACPPARLRRRGFAFVDFATKQEARNAMEAVAGAHLYGRRLVLEWAGERLASLESDSLAGWAGGCMPEGQGPN